MTSEQVTQKLEAFREELIALCAKHRVDLSVHSDETFGAYLIPEGRELAFVGWDLQLSGLVPEWQLAGKKQ